MAFIDRIPIQSLVRRGAVYAVKVATLGAGVVVSLLLARLGGPELLGSYSVAIQTAQLVSIIAVLGCDQLMLREIASRLRLGQQAAAVSAIGHYARFVLPLGLGVTLAYVVLVEGLALAGVRLAADPAILAATGFVAANVLYLLGLGTVRGLGNPVTAQLFDGLYLVPLALVLAVMALAGSGIGAASAVALSTLLLLLTMAGLALTVRRITNGWGRDPGAVFQSPWQLGPPMMATSFLLFFVYWLPLFLAGVLGSAADAGAFRAAWQLAMPLWVIQNTNVSAISAQIAGDISEGRMDRARQRLNRNRLGVLGLSLPLAVPLLIWPDPIMRMLFGPEFTGHGLLVQGLVIAHMLVIAVGPVAAIVTMAGRNRETLPNGVASAVLMLGLALWLMPLIGMTGLVIAYGAAAALRTVTFWRLASTILRPSA